MPIVSFSYTPPINSNLTVTIVGDFNGWNKQINPLMESNGTYSIELDLPLGTYKYRFLVNEKWHLDLNADSIIDNGVEYSTINVSDIDEELFIVPIEISNIHDLKEVSIVGDFNKWIPNTNRLFLNSKNRFSTVLFLKRGNYQFKFLASENRWFNAETINLLNDSNNAVAENSFLTVNSALYSTLGSKVTLTNLDSISSTNDFIQVTRYSNNEFEFLVNLPLMPIEQLYLKVANEYYKMEYLGATDSIQGFRTSLTLDDIHKLYNYQVVITNRDYTLYANGSKLSSNNALSSLLVPKNINKYILPSWASEAVMYQIFPDRFCNGDDALNQDMGEWYYDGCKKKPPLGEFLTKNQEYYHFIDDWYDISTLKQNPILESKLPDWWCFYGGDLKGVASKTSYLEELGVNLIYFNPLFESKSVHKYDSTTFTKIDPHFGTNESFKELVKQLKEKGIRTIMDVALNHTGNTAPEFVDCINNGSESNYWSWYDWKQWPLPKELNSEFVAEEYYQCWWGIKELPDLKYDLSRGHPEENKISDINQAVPNLPLVNSLLDDFKYWIEDIGIDGYRLDVPEEVPFWFWELFRDTIKDTNSESYIVGEIWHGSKRWLTPKYFDGIMSYSYFRVPVLDYFLTGKATSSDFVNTIQIGLLSFPKKVLQCQMNLLGSHDTNRIRDIAKGNVSALKLAILFQFTFIGIPHIYYGDEIFMAGEKDPDNRRPFNWKYESSIESNKMLNYYKKLIKLRKDHKALTIGTFLFIKNNSNLIIYDRTDLDSGKTLRIIINNSDNRISISDYSKKAKVIFGEINNHILKSYSSLILDI